MDFQKLKDWLIDKWLAGFITGTGLFFAKILWEMKPEERGNLLSFDWFWNLLKKGIPVWQISIGFFVFVFLHKIQIRKLTRIAKPVKRPIPPFDGYRKDVFGGWNETWAWQYQYNYSDNKGEVEIVELRPICPVCDNIADYSALGGTHLTCPKCRLEGRVDYYRDWHSIQYDVDREIRRRIESKEYLQRI